MSWIPQRSSGPIEPSSSAATGPRRCKNRSVLRAACASCATARFGHTEFGPYDAAPGETVVGAVLGTLIGVLLLGTVSVALPILGVSGFWQSATYGAIILLALLMDRLVRRRSQ